MIRLSRGVYRVKDEELETFMAGVGSQFTVSISMVHWEGYDPTGASYKKFHVKLWLVVLQ